MHELGFVTNICGMDRARTAARDLVGRLGDAADPVLVASLYVAADNVDRAETEEAKPGAVAYCNADYRQARRDLVESMGGADADDPFSGLDSLLRAAAVRDTSD